MMQANRISPCSCSYVPAGHSGSACSAGFSGRSLPVQTQKRCRRARPLATAALHAPEHLQDLLPPLMDHLFMAYERVTLPCHTMGCGDYVHRRCAAAFLQACFEEWTQLDILCLPKQYVAWQSACLQQPYHPRCARARSTLDPVLRLERKGITPQGVALLSAVMAYLFARPGMPAEHCT